VVLDWSADDPGSECCAPLVVSAGSSVGVSVLFLVWSGVHAVLTFSGDVCVSADIFWSYDLFGVAVDLFLGDVAVALQAEPIWFVVASVFAFAIAGLVVAGVREFYRFHVG